MDINIELYRTFYYIAKEGTITKAADRLFISQSAVTQSLKKLEEQLGGTLFVRNKSGVKLTNEGQKLFNYIEKSIITLNNADNLFSQYMNDEIGTIRIATGSALGKLILSEVMKEFCVKYPKLKIETMNSKTKEGKEKLMKNEIDMLFVEGNLKDIEPSLNVIPLTKFKFCFYTTKEYLKSIGEFNLENINNYTFIFPQKGTRRFDMLNNKLKDNGIEIEPKYMFSSANITEEIIKNGIGIGYCNELFIKEELKNGTYIKLDLGIELSEEEIAIVVKDIETASNATLKFIELAKIVFKL